MTFGLQAARSPTGLKYGYPVWPYAMFAFVALLAALGDIRMLVHRGVSGTPRLVRHLWRMCFAFFIASASIFLARPHLFPALLRKNVIPFLGVLPLILMLFWLVRVRFANAYKKKLDAPHRRCFLSTHLATRQALVRNPQPLIRPTISAPLIRLQP